MEDYTIVEKYQHQKQSSSIAVRPYFNPGKENMGLETYGLSLHDGVFHEESLACLEMNGVKRYVTGLNEFAPGKPLTLEAIHADGSKDIIILNHTYNQSQIDWYNEGSALNLIKRENNA